jgi:hypothetical protein
MPSFSAPGYERDVYSGLEEGISRGSHTTDKELEQTRPKRNEIGNPRRVIDESFMCEGYRS